MTKRIVTMPAARTREAARQALKGKWTGPVLGGVIGYVLTVVAIFVVAAICVLLVFQSEAGMEASDELGIGITIFLYAGVIAAAVCVGGILTAGLQYMLLRIARGESPSAGAVFCGYRHFLKLAGLIIVMCIRILLWSVLLIVPGIIAAYRYQMSIYIMLDDPDKGISRCIEESKHMMDGNKMKLFCLEISFIGWVLLASVPSVIGSILMENDAAGFGVPLVLELISAFLVLLVEVYIYEATGVFYQMLIGERHAGASVGDEGQIVLDDIQFPELIAAEAVPEIFEPEAIDQAEEPEEPAEDKETAE